MSLLRILVIVLLVAVLAILMQDAGLPDRRHALFSLLLGVAGVTAGTLAALVEHVSPGAALTFSTLRPGYSGAVGLGYVFLAYAATGLADLAGIRPRDPGRHPRR